ncbi:hypothetical protein [Oleiagrimonas sp. MCCC 1A03011]|uniref:hypothetical protein n=1 Tax=Oleiagrimonas sp. MCCC 1A03011 TaxID=1926883 RepID=UPI000DC21785|nr:hypothetical protein [Oleiagrimonas sp. MCCC 1A03011]RAP59586.1 hypothetical protein BTJ49_02755 [Oleiagrimonas sp. MCCC 1A03011]
MANTIELLESIGKNASLRHASDSDLEKMLNEMQASDALKHAASTRNAEHLKQELGAKVMGVNNTPVNGGCEEDEEEGTADKKPDQEHHEKS